MFSQTAEYALRVAVYLAGIAGGPPATIRQIHTATRVPEGYLAKVLQALGRANIIRSHRGLHGGSALALPADQLTVYAVMQAVHPFLRIGECPVGIRGHNPQLCPLHRRLDQALAMVEEVLRTTTIAQVVQEGDGQRLLGDGAAAPAPPQPAARPPTEPAPPRRRK
jgi:Rrf2 family nitric oxide-sensitive transcriptional repressor